MSLPITWIDRIFAKLTITYGREFVARWDNCGVPIMDVKTEWGHELSGFRDHPDAIAYALCNLPDRPPTVLQFREICRKAPPPVVPRLCACAWSASPSAASCSHQDASSAPSMLPSLSASSRKRRCSSGP